MPFSHLKQVKRRHNLDKYIVQESGFLGRFLDFKAKHAEKFLQDGNKVKAYVQFKGRAIMFQDRGQLLLLKFAERLAEAGTLESMPKLEGKRMFAIFQPKAGGKKKASS